MFLGRYGSEDRLGLRSGGAVGRACVSAAVTERTIGSTLLDDSTLLAGSTLLVVVMVRASAAGLASNVRVVAARVVRERWQHQSGVAW